MGQMREIMAAKMHEAVYSEVYEEVSTNGRKTVDCESIANKEIAKSFDSESKEKCKKGEVSDNHFFEVGEFVNTPFEKSNNEDPCIAKTDNEKIATFQSMKELLLNKLKGDDIDFVKLCELTKVKYREMESRRRKDSAACSSAEKAKCQIADSNGNCPGSEEAKAFVIEKPEEVKVVAGSNSLESKLQRIRADKKKCKEERDPYACGRLRSRGGKGFGK